MRWLVGVTVGGSLALWAWAAPGDQLPQHRYTDSYTGPTIAVSTVPVAKKPHRTVKVDLNTATQQQLQMLKGIGPAKARAIVQHRQKLGGFTRITQLLEVKGIGSKLLKQLQHQTTISSQSQKKHCPVQPGLCQR
ncbi:MAG: helix-hairpin-helix domain-containing protein [Myxococcota bacterium]